MPDWIDRFVEVTEGISAPTIFRLWAAIGAVAGSMERRIWCTTNISRLYPNLYIMLVAPPGIGKTQAIQPIETILKAQLPNVNIAPKSMTKAAVIDTLRDARRMVVLDGGKGMLEYHSLQILCSELGVLISSHDLEFLALVNEIFDNGDTFRERRRHVNGGKEIQISNPQFNIIAGAQPALLNTILPEEAWGLGTTSRFIMVFAGEGHKPDLFGRIVNRDEAYKDLAAQMRPWTSMHGQFQWDEKAIPTMRKYYAQDFAPVPDNPKLLHYNTRRTQFIIKLSMVSALSATSELLIREYDVERARHWLLEVETRMPDIFTAMSLKTDMQLLEELHIYIYKEYRANKFAPVREEHLHAFLAQRVYAERIPRIIELAKKSGLIIENGQGYCTPSPRLDMGIL